MSGLLRFLDDRSREFLLAASLLVVVLLTLVDYLTGPELRFFIFYWPPIAAVAWFVGRRWSYLFVLFSALGWFLANVVENLRPENLATVTWNTSANLASFILLAHLIARLRDTVERERLTARTDYVTGVPNSRAFAESLARALADARRGGVPFTIAYMDLDRFKLVNDRYGHSAGDDMLRAVAQAMAHQLRTTDTVARLGGDEFGILLAGTDGAAAPAAIARLRGALDELIAARGWPISVSTGVVSFAHGDLTGDDVIKHADALMYSVKTAAAGSVEFTVVDAPRPLPPGFSAA